MLCWWPFVSDLNYIYRFWECRTPKWQNFFFNFFAANNGNNNNFDALHGLRIGNHRFSIENKKSSIAKMRLTYLNRFNRLTNHCSIFCWFFSAFPAMIHSEYNHMPEQISSGFCCISLSLWLFFFLVLLLTKYLIRLRCVIRFKWNINCVPR